MQKVITVIILVLLVLGGIWFATTRNNETPVEEENGTTVGEEETNEEEPTEEEGEEEAEVKEFVVTGEAMSFDPEEIRVNEGDTVRIVFRSVTDDPEMVHDFTLDEFDVQTEMLADGEEETVEFVASEAGEYEYYCSVGEHRALGMVGTLIVE